MKAHHLRSSLRAFAPAVVSLFALACTASLPAATLFWDVNGDATDATYGGTGTWDLTNTFWNNSATIGSGTALSAWDNAASPLNSANFLRGTTGTVTVSGTVNALSVGLGSSTGSFTSGSGAYTLTGGTLDLRQTTFGSDSITNTTGTNIVDSAIVLWGTGSIVGTKITANGGKLTINGGISDGAGLAVAHSFTMASFSGGILEINGNITKAGSTGITFNIGSAGTANSGVFALGGNNTGLTGAATLNRGTLTLNNTNALVGAASVTVANANSTVALADTANLLIGTGGVTLNKNITYTALTSTDTSDIRTLGGSNTSGTATYSGTVTLGAFAASGTGSSLRVTSASGGTVAFSGNITDGTNTVALLLNGTGIVKFTRGTGMNYDGGTTISSGTLLVTNTSGSGTGSGTVSVGNTATFGGSGIVSGATTAAAGSFLSPGSDAGATGNLTFGGTLDLAGLASGTGGLLFDLDTTAASDKVTLSAGALSIGSGTLNFNDFAFTTLGGFGVGTYTLFDTNTSIVGTLGTNLTGTIGGLDAALAFADGGQDLVLTVTSSIPEPSTYAALIGTLALAGAVWRRRAVASR